jgi:hypothetical protein
MVAGRNHDGSILFLSCDLQNSTQFKQKSADGWVATFLAFYSEFPSLLATRITDSYPALQGRLSLWKAIGDELIFSVRIQSEQECSDAIDAWMATMLEFERQHLLGKTPMTLKGGAFLATVPSPDRRVAVPRTVQILDGGTQRDAEATNEDTLNGDASDGDFAINFAMDFVGPSIDTGFRVLKFAARGYFVLTVEVAHLLFKHYNDDRTQRGRKAYLLGTHTLKGVWGGRPYPVFAIERPLEAPTPAQLLAKAFGDGDNNPGLVTDEFPHRKPGEVLEAIEAYRSAEEWKGAIYAPGAHEQDFQNHQAVVDVRQYLDNLFDTSEDLLRGEDDPGDETSVDEDLPRD